MTFKNLKTLLKQKHKEVDSDFTITRHGEGLLIMPNKKEEDVARPIWTKAQAADLDRRFGEVHARIDRLEKEVADLRVEMNEKFNTIINILARNGIK